MQGQESSRRKYHSLITFKLLYYCRFSNKISSTIDQEFRLECSDDQVYKQKTDPSLISKFIKNAPSADGYTVVSVHPSIQLHPRTRERHRIFVMYKFNGEITGLQNIKKVRDVMNRQKPTNAVIGTISIIPGGYNVEYKNYCRC